jgi:hypothetical protein
MADLPAAHAGDGDGITISNPPGPDPDFLSGPLQTLGPFTMQGFADPDEHFDVATMSIPSLGITDVLTSRIDPSDHLALADPGLGLPADVTAGTADVTVNTVTDTMNPALDSSFTIPFTDPLPNCGLRCFHSAPDLCRADRFDLRPLDPQPSAACSHTCVGVQFSQVKPAS